MVLFVFSAVLFLALPFLSQGRLVRTEIRGFLGFGREFGFILCVVPVFLLGIFFIGFRPLDAGNDTARYVEAYSQLTGPSSAWLIGAEVYGNTEFLWWPAQSLLSSLVDARGWLVVNYLLTFFMVFLSFKVLCRKYSVSCLLFAFVFFSYYFVYAGNTIRQVVALPGGLLALCFFMEKRYWRSLFFIVFSIGMHWSAIFFLLAPILVLPVFKKRWVLASIPLVVFCFSIFVEDVARIFVDLVGVDGLRAKYQLYIESGRESHVGSIWKKFNFWIAIVVPYIFLILCRPSRYESNVLHIYVLLFLSLIIFGWKVADFSERFIPALLLVLPLLAVLIIRRFELPAVVSESVLVLGFFSLWIMIFFSDSAIKTLGYELLL